MTGRYLLRRDVDLPRRNMRTHEQVGTIACAIDVKDYATVEDAQIAGLEIWARCVADDVNAGIITIKDTDTGRTIHTLEDGSW